MSKKVFPAIDWSAPAKSVSARVPPGAPRFVLGSSSRSRRELLEAAGGTFDVMNPDIDEKKIGDRNNGDAETLVKLVATAKADALADRLSSSGIIEDDERVLLTGDQVIVYDGKIREKPRDLHECRDFVKSYSHKPCRTVGAVCLHSLKTGRRRVGVHESAVHFAPIPDAVVDEMLARDGDLLMRCAGGLMVEHPLVQPYLVDVVGGVDSVMGLSLALVVDLLQQLLQDED